MNHLKSCESGHIDDDRTEVVEDAEWDDCKSRDREHVNALLDISEEHSFQELEPYEVQNQVGWEEAIQGWGRAASLVCLLQAQRKGRKVKPEPVDSHCLLCADLKDLKLPERPASDCADTSSESSCQAAEEPLKSTVPSPMEFLKRAPRNSSSCSSSTSEEETSDLSSIEEMHSKTDIQPVLLGGEQFIHHKTLPHHLQPTVRCPFLKDRGAGKVALISTLLVLPPVKPPTPANPRSHTFSKRREAQWSREREANPIAVAQKVVVDGDDEKAAPYCSSAVDICQGALTAKYGPAQHQYHLLSIPVSKKAQLPFSTLDDTLPHASSILSRNFRQEELTRLPLRHSSGHRAHSGFKPRSTKRAEPELPMLLGTRVAIPVSAQRLL
ncbi:uncharacterized protein C16orf46 homolog isoform X2 [Salminus brasiliensis]